MKSRTIFLSLLAFAAATFTGCRQEEADIDLPGIQVSGSDLTFDAETKKAACAVDMDLTTLTLSITANRAWTADIKWDSDEVPWIAVTPDAGEGSDSPQRVVVTILNNAGYNRAKQVKFSINYDYKTIDFSQTGERGEEVVGTLDHPLSVAGAIKYVKSLGADVQSPKMVYIKGKVSQIASDGAFSESGKFGNATFYISDDGLETGDQFYCYRVLYLGNRAWSSKTDTDVKVGDDVIICGYVVNYKGNTPETVANTAFVYEHNGKSEGTGGGGSSTAEPSGTGTEADPYNVAAAIAAVKPLTWTSDKVYDATDVVYVKGKISRIGSAGTFSESGTYGNATFYISDDGTQAGELYCYRILYLGNKKYTSGDDIKVGDDVVVCGKLMNYRGNTPETVSNEAYLYSLNSSGGGGGGGETPSGEASGTGTLADPYNPLGAANAVKNLTWTDKDNYEKTEKVYVKGKISRIANNGTYVGGGTYGNASYWISADGTTNGEFQIFRSLYFNGEKYTEGTDIKVGDEVIVYGALMNYQNSTPETVANENWLYSLNGDTGSGGGGGGGETPSGFGSGTLADPYTPAGAADAVKGLTWTDKDNYEKTEKVYVKGKISRIANKGTYVEGGSYGNASYWISADGTTEGEFQIFRSLYFNGEKYTEGTDIKVGDEVIVYGALMNYQNNTPETVANENWLYSLNGKTEVGSGGGGGGETPSGGTVSFSTNSNAQSWAAETDGTYGAGFSSTTQGLKIGYYKHTSSQSLNAPNANHVRVYKNSVLSIASTEGKKIKKIVIGCAPNSGTTSFCFDLTGLEGTANATADKNALTVTWTGSAAKVVFHANNGQVRMEKLTVEFE